MTTNRVFSDLIKRSHPSAIIGIDHVIDYGDRKVVLFRTECSAYQQHRCAVFSMRAGSWSKDNDIIVSQS